MIPKNLGQKDYLGGIADSTGALADREGDGVDLKTNRAEEITGFALRVFGEFKHRIATGVCVRVGLI